MSRHGRLWVIKIGGSVDEEPGALSRLLSSLAPLAGRERMMIVPGGGVFADFVRGRRTARTSSDETAHFQAVLSMAQFGYDIAGSPAFIQPVHDKAEMDWAFRNGLVPVFIPYPWILGVPGIATSWSVTSDTIAAHVCRGIGASRLVLLKSVDGALDVNGEVVPLVDAGSPPKTDVVDPSFFASLASGWETWIINGRKPERLKELMENGTAFGTRVFS